MSDPVATPSAPDAPTPPVRRADRDGHEVRIGQLYIPGWSTWRVRVVRYVDELVVVMLPGGDKCHCYPRALKRARPDALAAARTAAEYLAGAHNLGTGKYL